MHTAFHGKVMLVLMVIAGVALAGLNMATAEGTSGEKVSYALIYNAGEHGVLEGQTSQVVSAGANGLPVKAIADEGYHFAGWSDGVTDNPRTDVNVTANITVTANFAINTYTLSYSAGAGGAIFGTTPQTVMHGENGEEVVATAKDGFTFLKWSDDLTDNPRIDMNVTENIDVTALFAVNTYILTYSAGPGGMIEGQATQVVNHGGSGIPVAAEANTGYLFVVWGDGLTDNPRQDKNVKKDISVMAHFAVKDIEGEAVEGETPVEGESSEGEAATEGEISSEGETAEGETGEGEAVEGEGETTEGEAAEGEGETTEGEVETSITVPNVVLQDLEEATEQIEEASLTVGTVSYKCNNQVPAGAVVRQSPEAGVTALAGEPVSLIISEGNCPTACDNFDLRDWGNVFLGILAVVVLLLATVFGVESLS